jgi:hypothetical protein
MLGSVRLALAAMDRMDAVHLSLAQDRLDDEGRGFVRRTHGGE